MLRYVANSQFIFDAVKLRINTTEHVLEILDCEASGVNLAFELLVV